MVKIAPSILAADSAKLGDEAALLEACGADFIHFDVMDGHFVPNITFGPKILADMKKHTRLPFDVHLMVNEPQLFVPWFAKAGAEIITFHLEAVDNCYELIKLIHSFGCKAGISIKPRTSATAIEPFCDIIDLVLIMSVEPGFGGQKFIETTPKKIRKIKEIISNRPVLTEVDGGINKQTAELCRDAGADILVAGTAVFADDDYRNNILTLKGE